MLSHRDGTRVSNRIGTSQRISTDLLRSEVANETQTAEPRRWIISRLLSRSVGRAYFASLSLLTLATQA